MEKNMREKNENMSLVMNSIVPRDVEDILSDFTKWLDGKVFHRAQKLIKKRKLLKQIHF